MAILGPDGTPAIDKKELVGPGEGYIRVNQGKKLEIKIPIQIAGVLLVITIEPLDYVLNGDYYKFKLTQNEIPIR